MRPAGLHRAAERCRGDLQANCQVVEKYRAVDVAAAHVAGARGERRRDVRDQGARRRGGVATRPRDERRPPVLEEVVDEDDDEERRARRRRRRCVCPPARG